MNIKILNRYFEKMIGYSLYLNEIRKNLAGDRPTLFAETPDRRFRLNFVPFMQYAG